MMKKLIVLIILAITYSNCNLTPDCEWNDTFPEMDDIAVVDGFTIQDVIVASASIDSLHENLKVIVNDDTEYQIWKIEAQQENCQECSFPTIDFNTQTLVGWYLNLGCKGVIIPKIIKNADLDYTFALKFSDESQCTISSCTSRGFVWVTIDKLPENSKINLEEHRAYYTCTNC